MTIQRVNLSMTPDRLAKLDRLATSYDLTRSATIARLIDRVSDVATPDDTPRIRGAKATLIVLDDPMPDERTPDAPETQPEPAIANREVFRPIEIGDHICPDTLTPHRTGGFGATGMVQRCQDCGMRKVAGKWTGIVPTTE